MGEVEDLLSQIKECWPQLIVTKENLLRPTQELVFQFYSRFIDDYHKKITDLTGVSATFDFNSVDYEPEEQLFLQLCRLLGKIYGLKFTLADIYQPTYIRTKNFFKVCIHFISFTEYLYNEVETLGDTVFKTKEDMTKLLMEQQELTNEINENARNKAELNENKILLEENLKSTRNTYKEMKAIKASKEKLYGEKRNQIENLKRELQNEEYEFKLQEKMEKDLLEQRISEGEHQNILHTIETLKNETEMLDNDDIDIGDGLVHENKVLQHSADCIRILNKCDFNVKTVKKQICLEEELRVMLNTVDNLTSTKLNPVKQQKFDGEQKLAVLKEKLINLLSEYKIVKDNYTITINQFSKELGELIKGHQDKSKNNSKISLEYKRDIEKLEGALDKMRKAFTNEYVKVSTVEKKVLDDFKDTIMRFKETEK